LRAKKSYGQNFLINQGIVEKIVHSFVTHNTCDNVLEVGPGKGALTQLLAQEDIVNLKAVEADREMVDYLLAHDILNDSQIIQDDFLKLPLDRVFGQQEFSVIGNFPYNISSQILFRIKKYMDLVPLMVGMFQKEVAERIVSKEGSKAYGILSVLIQAHYEAKLLFNVSPGSFRPIPKVTSSIVMLKRKQDYVLPCDEKVFTKIVKLSFNQRRKMLRNSLKPVVTDTTIFSHEYMTRRPEQMKLEDYYTLATIIEKQEE
jgi:16S rRNA (adenine1518-N6/adenine1519-N6)-dimethyltransferase